MLIYLDDISEDIALDELNESHELPLAEITTDQKRLFCDRTVILGRSHDKTSALFSRFSSRYNHPGIIYFDAHADCLSSDDIVPRIGSSNIIMAGLRSIRPRELAFLRKNKIRIFSMKQISEEGIRETADTIMAISRSFDALYISIDLDVLDPAFYPVKSPEPGGLSTRDLIYFIQRLKHLRNLRAMDTMEINPPDMKTVKKLISEFY